jgi:NTP pyrophosphatase (non-canonical NTP hydrolase)
MAHDQTTTVAELRDLVREFVRARDWEKFHAPKNLAMSVAIEAAELMEHFQWLDVEASRHVSDPAARHAIGEELADVLSYCLALANAMEFDVSAIMRAKMIRNAEKYPLGKSER